MASERRVRVDWKTRNEGLTGHDWLTRLKELLESSSHGAGDGLAAIASLRGTGARQGLRPAAVLIGLTGDPLQFILTRRQERLADHPGEVAFPGGARDPSDRSPEQNALRETWEEIGLPPESVTILGKLAPHITTSGYYVWPIVGWVAEMNLSVADVSVSEVAEVFCVPSHLFLDEANWRSRWVQFKNRRYLQWELEYDGRRIWGATAAMLRDLLPLLRQALVP